MSWDKAESWNTIYEWWEKNIFPRAPGSRARALSAELRREKLLRTLYQPEVQDLLEKLNVAEWPSEKRDRFVVVLGIIANVRGCIDKSLARCLGGKEPVMKPLRFEKILKNEGDDWGRLMRRAIYMIEYKCNVRDLVRDMLLWDDSVKKRWCSDYFMKGDSTNSDN